MAFRLVGHFQKQCWNINNKTLRNKLQWKFNRNSNTFIQENSFEGEVCEKAAILSRPHFNFFQYVSREFLNDLCVSHGDPTLTSFTSPIHFFFLWTRNTNVSNKFTFENLCFLNNGNTMWDLSFTIRLRAVQCNVRWWKISSQLSVLPLIRVLSVGRFKSINRQFKVNRRHNPILFDWHANQT